MSDVNVSSNLSAGAGMISDGERIDMDALREISVAEYDREYGAPKSEEAPAPKEKKAATPPPEEEDTEEEEIYEEEKEEEEEAEGEESEESEEEETQKADDETDEGDYILARAKNGRQVKVAKDATFEVKIDGKIENLTVQEVVNRASGAVAYDRKHTELGRERAALQQEKEKFEEYTQVTNDNLAALTELAQNGTPEDFVQYYGALMGKDPHSLLEGIIGNAIKYAEQFSQMTDREKMLYNENRKFKFSQNLQKITQQREAKKQTDQKERAQVESRLSEEGLEMKDFLAAAQDVRQQIQAGKLKGTYSPLDIVEYASWLKTDSAVRDGIKAVNQSLLSDDEFVTKVSKAISRTQTLEGGRMSPAEIRTFVKKAADAQKKGISESLTRKAARHVKSGKTNSKLASSRNQEKNSGEAITLAEHRERLYGGD